jgi:hypothetical protein
MDTEVLKNWKFLTILAIALIVYVMWIRTEH